MKAFTLAALGLAVAASAPAARADAPAYTIIDLGVVGTATASQARGISPDGSVVVGRALGSQSLATTWTAQAGMVALPNLSGRNHAVAYGANNNDIVVGTSATSVFGSSPLPVAWNHGVVSALQLPSGFTAGQAYGVNGAGVVAGTVIAGFVQRAALFSGGSSSVITATTANGSYMTAAFGINDAGLVVGIGVDPSDAALNVGLVYDSVSGNLSSVGALNGADGALTYGLSSNGYVVGSSTFQQGPGSPYIWSAAGGMVEIPLPADTDRGSAHGVNAQGWAVGTAGGEFAVPFLYAGGSTYALQSLLPAGSDWDLSSSTVSSAEAISETGTIVGTGVHNGEIHAYEMLLVSSVPEPASWALLLAGLGLSLGAARRRRVA